MAFRRTTQASAFNPPQSMSDLIDVIGRDLVDALNNLGRLSALVTANAPVLVSDNVPAPPPALTLVAPSPVAVLKIVDKQGQGRAKTKKPVLVKWWLKDKAR